MKFLSIVTLAAGIVSAAPAVDVETRSIEARQLSSSTDLESGSSSNCPSVILIFARASGESGNMVRSDSKTLGLLDDGDILTDIVL